MNFKNLNVNWKKVTAVLLAGTMMFGFTGCKNEKEEVDPETAYVQMLDKELDKFLNKSMEYNKAKDIYMIYPTLENLNNLKTKTEELSEIINDELQNKIGVDFFAFICFTETGDKEYTLTDKNNPDVAYTHFVKADGESFGEIASPLMLEALLAPSEIPIKSTEKWSKEEIINFIKLGEKIEENGKKIFITDFEIENGCICEVEQKIKKNTKE